MPRQDQPTNKTAFEIGQWDRLNGNTFHPAMFFLVSEQLAYQKGWDYEQMELDEVLPYITPFTPRKGEGHGNGSR